MRLVASNGVICAAWEDARSDAAVYGACSADAGVSFGANGAISSAGAEKPHIALGPDNALYARYGDTDTQRTITLRRSADRGAPWGPAHTAVSVDTPEELFGWALAVDANGQIVLPWAAGTTGIRIGGGGRL